MKLEFYRDNGYLENFVTFHTKTRKLLEIWEPFDNPFLVFGYGVREERRRRREKIKTSWGKAVLSSVQAGAR